MKFSELHPERKPAFKELTIAPLLKQIDFLYNLEGFGVKILLLANGTGLLLGASLFGSIKEKGASFSSVFYGYFVGLITAGLIYFLIWSVTAWAVDKNHKEISQVFNDEIDIGKMQRYGLSKRGKLYYMLLSFTSLSAFLYASLKGIKVVTTL